MKDMTALDESQKFSPMPIKNNKVAFSQYLHKDHARSTIPKNAIDINWDRESFQHNIGHYSICICLNEEQ